MHVNNSIPHISVRCGIFAPTSVCGLWQGEGECERPDAPRVKRHNPQSAFTNSRRKMAARCDSAARQFGCHFPGAPDADRVVAHSGVAAQSTRAQARQVLLKNQRDGLGNNPKPWRPDLRGGHHHIQHKAMGLRHRGSQRRVAAQPRIKLPCCSRGRINIVDIHIAVGQFLQLH